MRWWLALGASVFVLLVVALLGRGTREPQHGRDMVKVVQSSRTAPPIALLTQQVVVKRALPAAPLVSTTAPILEEEAPSWAKVSPELEPRALYAKIRREARDREWAPRAESAIRLQLATIPYVGGSSNSSIRCASTICEITGSAPADLPDANLNVAWLALQDAPFRDALQKQGLKSEAGIFGAEKGKSTFTLYYTRSENDR